MGWDSFRDGGREGVIISMKHSGKHKARLRARRKVERVRSGWLIAPFSAFLLGWTLYGILYFCNLVAVNIVNFERLEPESYISISVEPGKICIKEDDVWECAEPVKPCTEPMLRDDGTTCL